MDFTKQPSMSLMFLKWFVTTYGYESKRTYRQIAADTGRICFMTVKHHLVNLEKMGALQIENKGTRHQVLHILKENADMVLSEWQLD